MRVALLVCGIAIVTACSRPAPTSPTAPSAQAPAEAWAARGAVHDTIGRPIVDARVEVQSGPHRGAAAFTDQQGNFTFDKIFDGPATARASKAGYRDQTLSIIGPANPTWFHLDSVNGAVPFFGNYTLTFTADSACAIPGYARRRRYEATVGSSGGTILVTLAGGGYGGIGSGGYFNNVLYAGVFEDTLALYMSDPPVLERFPQGSYLFIAGEAIGSIRQLPATVPVSGWFIYCAESAPGSAGSEPRCAVTESRCESSNHQLTVASR